MKKNNKDNAFYNWEIVYIDPKIGKDSLIITSFAQNKTEALRVICKDAILISIRKISKS